MKRAITYLLIFFGVIIALPACLWVLGHFLPQSHTVSVSQTFDATQEEVYQLVTDIKSYPFWRSNVTKVAFLKTDGEIREWREYYTDNDPLSFRIHKPDSSLVFTEIIGDDLPFGGRWFFNLENRETGTGLTITEKGEVYNPLFRVISKYFMGHDTTIRRYLADLERELETSKPDN